MTGRLPWATAAILIVAAVAVGTWAIFSTPTQTTPPTTGSWSQVTNTLGFTGNQKSGIVAVYIAKTGQDYDDNWDTATTDNYYYKFTATSQSGNIAYETPFVFLVEVVGHNDNMAYVVKENLRVEFSVTSGSWTLAAENTDGGDGVEWVYNPTGDDNIGINAVWDNNGNFFDIPAGGSIDWQARLFTWS